jgi:hypothetical protein
MSGHGERRVKARHEITQFYERRKLPRGDMMIGDDPNPNNNSLGEDVEDETYVPSPRARPHDKGLASSSGSGAMRDEELKKMMVMRVKRMKKYLMLKRSTLHHMLTLDILISGLLRTLHGG